MPLDGFPADAVLQALAAENNLAETAFIVRDRDDFQIRWFTPVVEVPLCGHATLASAAVVMERLEPHRQTVRFHSASGPLIVRRVGRAYAMDFPARRCSPVETTDDLARSIGASPIETVWDGFNFLVRLASAQEVRAIHPDFAAVASLPSQGVIVTAPGEGGYDCISRYFAPAKGIPEDPVTGGAHCALTPFWSERLGKSELRARQASARGGEMTCRLLGDRVELVGECAFYLEGRATW